jgi:hypothetical protein
MALPDLISGRGTIRRVVDSQRSECPSESCVPLGS